MDQIVHNIYLLIMAGFSRFSLSLIHISPVLPYVLSFAAGTMIYVVVEELIPEAQTGADVYKRQEYSNTTLKLEISSEGYPLEYRVSKDGTFNDSVWKYLNVNDGVISPKNSDSGKVWIQTRNTFGVSKVIEVDLQAFSVE